MEMISFGCHNLQQADAFECHAFNLQPSARALRNKLLMVISMFFYYAPYIYT